MEWPADFAKIYKLNHSGMPGCRDRARPSRVVGETNINMADVQAFRTISGSTTIANHLEWRRSGHYVHT